jgi:hypothetical protein
MPLQGMSKWTADSLEYALGTACELAEELLRIGLERVERSAMVVVGHPSA